MAQFLSVSVFNAFHFLAELVIGFENTSLVVSESAGKVEFCVSIIQPSNAPVEIKFNLTVQTHAGTAG